MKAKKKPKVTVIMRSKNSDWVIAQALKGLFSQDYTDFELLVIDSGSTDKTLDIVKEYPVRLMEIEAKSYYPGSVLNMGIKEAKGEIIVFLNSDAVPLSPHSLTRLVAAFDDAEVHAAFARQIPRPEADSWVKRDYAKSFPDSNNAPEWIKLSLPMAAIRKSIWEEHHFYTDAWASEDTEWGNWAKRNGYKIFYVKDAIVMHSHNYTLRQVYGRRFVEGEADVFIYGGKERRITMVRRMITSIIKDTIIYLKNLDFSGLPVMPIRRIIYHWAYYKGHFHGEQRIKKGDTDTSAGQGVVLSRYDK